MLSPEVARAGDPLKPYVVLVLDTSGSMAEATGSGPPSCGGSDTKLDHARCAIRKIVNSYGDMVFALGRFRMAMSGTTTAATFPAGCSTNQPFCSKENDQFELLTPLVDGNNDSSEAWVNLTGNTCTATGTDPEVWLASGSTPIEGSLRGARLYWNGTETTTIGRCSASTGTICTTAANCPTNPANQTCNFVTSTIFPSNQTGFSPIVNDPTKDAFLPKLNKPATCNSNRGPGGTVCDDSAGCSSNNCCCFEQCRPYITIMLTDGDETCGGTPANAAASLLATDMTINGTTRRYRIETKPIGFGKPPGDAEIEAIAQAGGAANGPGNEGFYASDEASLQLAISSILDDAIKTEKCNGLDDDCDGTPDEDFEPAKGEACDNGAIAQCLRTGTLVCNTAETGLTCNAQTVTCNGNFLVVNGSVTTTACGETCNNLDDDCDGKIDEGLTGCSCSPQQEQCNGRDDDCDGRIDEASTNGPKLTRPCGTGTCAGVETCNFVANCGPLPGAPGCSGFGGCTAQTPTTETCNGLDDNCDGIKDGLQAQCSTMNPLPPENFAVDDPRNNPGDPSNNPIPENICHPGFKICPVVAGAPNSFGSCQNEVKPCNGATNNTPDSCTDGCNGADDDCDNIIDEDFQPADCSNGCGIGTTQCVGGVLSCNSVAQPPGNDGCDGVDDDCDQKIDEDFLCGPGDITVAGTPKPGNTSGQCSRKTFSCDDTAGCIGANCCCECACDSPTTCNGRESCIGGSKVCQGDPISQESCDCSDNNCNGQTDEGNLCGVAGPNPPPTGGSVCSEFCQCAFPCAQTEFPCPLGKFCKQEVTGCSTLPACSIAAGCTGANCCLANSAPAGFSDPRDVCTQNPSRTDCTCRGLCITDPCFNIPCPPINGIKQVCQVNEAGNTGMCVDACDAVSCGDPTLFVCIPETGECKANDCTTFPDRCSANQLCVAGVCVTNLCKDITCPTDQYCAGGNCVFSCADIDCPSGQRCRLGVCEDDPCGAPCPFGQACNDNSGQCVPDGCGTITCPQGEYCNPNHNGGTCETDLCVGTACPEPDQICRGGTCFDPEDLGPDGGIETRVTAGGGGGCNTGGDAGLLLLGVALLFVRKRGAAAGRSGKKERS